MTQSQKQLTPRRARPQPRDTLPKAPIVRARAPAAIVRPTSTATPNEARALEFENISSTRMFETLGSFRAIGPRAECGPEYSKDEIYAVAEMGYHYLRCGGFKLAYVLFEALAAIDGRDAYFALALGLSAEKLGDRERAIEHYQRACKLDPRDPRPEVNLAEVLLETGDKPRALTLLQSAAKKASLRHDAALENKATAMLQLLGPGAR
jgi:tetratricopeptide (TPR) repeat protein